ncbi:hypothetical protein BJV78DRAFT_1259834 [Lactifluus subvellereus]|nr:hypothetical protein BJV78DRAFT_1259834 [Lactifluus subvellereus]
MTGEVRMPPPQLQVDLLYCGEIKGLFFLLGTEHMLIAGLFIYTLWAMRYPARSRAQQKVYTPGAVLVVHSKGPGCEEKYCRLPVGSRFNYLTQTAICGGSGSREGESPQKRRGRDTLSVSKRVVHFPIMYHALVVTQHLGVTVSHFLHAALAYFTHHGAERGRAPEDSWKGST